MQSSTRWRITLLRAFGIRIYLASYYGDGVWGYRKGIPGHVMLCLGEVALSIWRDHA